ncbi:Uncharacterised protein [Mycobacteroides abscessus subsp. abscessus]|nr:Uncharacterised protein [Mycobacteroides abscessus subsp. abscessus]
MDSACIFAKAASGRGWIADSVPPATTTSALPVRIRSRATCRASVPEAHAETTVCAAARALWFRETAAAAPLGISIGTVIGSTRRGPRSRSVSQLSSRVHTPPIPVPKDTATRSGSSSSLASASSPVNPASAQA